MRRFPQFLKTNPMFNGLTFIDIGALVGSLYLTQILGFPTEVVILSTTSSIVISKVLTKHLDLVGFLRPQKKVISLKDMYGGKK